MTEPLTPLPVDYFDGRVPQARPVLLRVQSGQLQLLSPAGEVLRSEPVQAVQWPERQRHGQRQAGLPGGGVLSAPDAPAWDAWARASGLGESPVVRWQQSWRGVVLALLLGVVVLGAAWRWGVPWAARQVVAVLPPVVASQAGEATLQALERGGLTTSHLPAPRQAALRAQWARAQQLANTQLPMLRDELALSRLEFRHAGRSGLGPNALALPGGLVIVTDELLDVLADRDDVLMGVLGHELGHVQAQHGLRVVVQAGMVAALAGAVVGDFSSVLAGLPAVLGQSAYSRDMEREADEAAVHLLRANHLSPEVMVTLFERLQAARRQQAKEAKEANESPTWLIAFNSHPADDERMAFFRQAARR